MGGGGLQHCMRGTQAGKGKGKGKGKERGTFGRQEGAPPVITRGTPPIARARGSAT